MNKPLNILLADDDKDDRFFFNLVLKEFTNPTVLTTVEDGVQLMEYLTKNSDNLPDVLFLDFNMPLKNGMECLTEIKRDRKLKSLPVIIYSTSLHEDVADTLYEKGAHYYIRKTDIVELRVVLGYLLKLLSEKKFERPKREKFIVSLPEIA